jgi:hypothetical protein
LPTRRSHQVGGGRVGDERTCRAGYVILVCRVSCVKRRRRSPYDVGCAGRQSATKRDCCCTALGWHHLLRKRFFPSVPSNVQKAVDPSAPDGRSQSCAGHPAEGMLLLFESPAGFALFKVLDEGKLKQADVRAQLPDPRPCSPFGNEPLDPHRVRAAGAACPAGGSSIYCLQRLGLGHRGASTSIGGTIAARRRSDESAAAAGGGWERRLGCTDHMYASGPGLVTSQGRPGDMAWRLRRWGV